MKFREYRISGFGKEKLDLVVFRGLYRGQVVGKDASRSCEHIGTKGYQFGVELTELEKFQWRYLFRNEFSMDIKALMDRSMDSSRGWLCRPGGPQAAPLGWLGRPFFFPFLLFFFFLFSFVSFDLGLQIKSNKIQKIYKIQRNILGHI